MVVGKAYVGGRQSQGLEHHDHSDDAALRYAGRGYGGRRGRNDDRKVGTQGQLKASNLRIPSKT